MNAREKLLLIWAVVATVLLIVVGAVVLRMLPPPLTNQFSLGSVDNFPIGSTTLLECDRAIARCAARDTLSLDELVSFNSEHSIEVGDQVRIWLTHDSAEEWHAFIAASPHRGCFVDWLPDRNRFEEGCYGSKWFRNGEYLEGPSPRGLDSFPVLIKNGKVLLKFTIIRGKPHD